MLATKFEKFRFNCHLKTKICQDSMLTFASANGTLTSFISLHPLVIYFKKTLYLSFGSLYNSIKLTFTLYPVLYDWNMMLEPVKRNLENYVGRDQTFQTFTINNIQQKTLKELISAIFISLYISVSKHNCKV